MKLNVKIKIFIILSLFASSLLSGIAVKAQLTTSQTKREPSERCNPSVCRCDPSGRRCIGTNNSPPSSDELVSSACYTVSSQQGWQYFNFPRTFSRITSISGSWSVDDRNYTRVSAEGHTGEAANRLAPYNPYKYDQNYPFGRLLVNIPNDGYISVNSPLILPRSINSTAMRINDSNNSLGDNGGLLRVCFSAD